MSNDDNDDRMRRLAEISPDLRDKFEKLRETARGLDARDQSTVKMQICVAIIVGELVQLVPGAATHPPIVLALKAMEGDGAAWDEIRQGLAQMRM